MPSYEKQTDRFDTHATHIFQPGRAVTDLDDFLSQVRRHACPPSPRPSGPRAREQRLTEITRMRGRNASPSHPLILAEEAFDDQGLQRRTRPSLPFDSIRVGRPR
jgi:hypothetical protein